MQPRYLILLAFLFSLFQAPAPIFADSPVDSLSNELDRLHEEVKVDLVNIYLTATNSAGAFITDLTPEDLIVKEDGVLQQITNFDRSATSASDPLTVVILIDTSLSMNDEFQNIRKIEMAKKGALLLIDQLQAKDKTLLVRFSDSASDQTGLISEKSRMKNAVRSIKSDNGLTVLLDAIELAARKLRNQRGQKLIFICSDGEDTASKHTTEDVFETLRESADITVVALGINALRADSDQGGQRLEDGRTLLQSLADNTGGYAFFPTDLKDLNRVMDNLKLLVAGAYSIAYRPSNVRLDHRWRKIEITSSRPGVKLKYRSGYYSR
jgi:Ca-activated chloride channel homolog